MDTLLPIGADPHFPVFEQIGAQLESLLKPTSNQVAVLAARSDRHGPALFHVLTRYLQSRRGLLNLIKAPPGSELSGELRTALRTATTSHHAAVAAAMAVSNESLMVLNEAQRNRIGSFSPRSSANALFRKTTRFTASRLMKLEEDLAAPGHVPKEALSNLGPQIEVLINSLGLGRRIGEIIQAIVADNIKFWTVHESVHPAGILKPAELARLISSLAGVPLATEPEPGWCSSLARAFDSPILPALAPDDRLKLAMTGLLLLTRAFLNPRVSSPRDGDQIKPSLRRTK